MRIPTAVAVSTATALLLSGCGLADARDQAIANAAVKPLALDGNLRPGLVGLPDYPSSGWEYSADGLTANPQQPSSSLASIGLQPGDVGGSLTISTIPDGDTLGTPTLDFCDGTYPSESLRVSRLQKAAYDADGNFAGLSSEVVVYKNGTAARQALNEAIAARKSCPTNKRFTSKDGHELSFAFHSAPGPASTPLVAADSRLIVHTTMNVDGVERRAFLVYQIYGRVLAALYVSEEGAKPFNQTALDSFYALAGDIADRLRSAPNALTQDEPQT